jgi:hypothetical protein
MVSSYKGPSLNKYIITHKPQCAASSEGTLTKEPKFHDRSVWSYTACVEAVVAKG